MSSADTAEAVNGCRSEEQDIEQQDVILQDEFLLYPKAKLLCKVTLKKEEFSYHAFLNGKVKETFETVAMRDIIGCQAMKGKSKLDSSGYFCVYAYPKKKKTLSSKQVRKRTTIIFVIDKFGTYEENMPIAQLWANAVRSVARGFMVTEPGEISSNEHKPMLVLLNPCSGPGRALQTFQERIVPMIAEAGIPYHLIVTDHAAHATEICKVMDISKWYGIVIMSGDGLIYEAVNGLMQRDDWEQAIKIPIGCLPGGSANALCCSINNYAGEPIRDDVVRHSTYILLKHRICPMDLVAVDTLNGRKYSFLSVTWGLVADVDIESEKYRFLGDARFTVGAVARVLNLRTYQGRLSFLPVGEYTITRSRSASEPINTSNIDRPTKRSESMYVSSEVIHTQEKVCASSDGDNSPTQIDEQNGAILPLDDIECITPAATQSDEASCITASGDAGNGIKKDSTSNPVSTYLLPALDEPVPDNWVSIEDSFITVCISYQSHLGPDLMIAPDATLSDGYIHVGILRSGISKSRIIQLFGDFETGKHVDSEEIEMIPVHAFRLEPLNDTGNIMVDGEQVPYGPVQAQILPSLARVMAI